MNRVHPQASEQEATEALDLFDPAHKALAEATLELYTDAYSNEDPQVQRQSELALQVWENLSELGLALPPDWVVAVWHAKEGARGNPPQ